MSPPSFRSIGLKKLYGRLYRDDLDIQIDGRIRILILLFVAVLGCFLSHFGLFFYPFAPPGVRGSRGEGVKG
jgi:hypothetical protein